MEIPFYRRPRFSQNFRSIPVTTGGETALSQPLKPRVVSIPVEFIQPQKSAKSRSDYALLIQKTWRGFRVRKSVEKIRDIKRDVDETERIILDSETVGSIRRDERERLKLSERLMALLFRLDSVRGFDIALKDLRKSVIRRTILLQEKVDSIATVDRPIDDGSDMKLCENIEQQNPDSGSESESTETSPGTIPDNPQKEEEEEKEEMPVEREVGVVKEEKSSSGLERMLEENNRLMKLMAELYEKSEMQTQILNSLSKRVGQLENAFACEKHCRRLKKQKKTITESRKD